MTIIHPSEQLSHAKFPTTRLLEGLDPRIYDRHPKLIGGWSTVQLVKVAEVLRTLCPGRSRKQLLAMASHCRSVYVVGHYRPGAGCHYSMSKKQFGRYSSSDPYGSVYLRDRAVTALVDIDLISYAPGNWKARKQSVSYETPKLMHALSFLGPE